MSAFLTFVRRVRAARAAAVPALLGLAPAH